MRVTETFNRLNERLSTELRRQYPLVYTQELSESFDRLTLGGNIEGNLAKIPYIQSLPQYKVLPRGDYDSGLEALAGEEWLGSDYQDLIDFMHQNREVSGQHIFFDPYEHQAEALKAWSKGSDIIVSTGTGSGKTECFLWPIAGHLHSIAQRAQGNPGEHRGVKAIILYPMNALVADQLKRLRNLFGSQSVAEALTEPAEGALAQGGENRPFQFGQYTGRTKFHGSYAHSGSRGGSVSGKVRKALSQFEMFRRIHDHPTTSPEEENQLYQQMMGKGLIPAKGTDESAHGSLYWNMTQFEANIIDQAKPNIRLITQHGDRELYYRHEMHNTGYSNLRRHQNQGGGRIITPETNGGGTPDILVTNYSMLEYMLKRPLEHGIFSETKQWLAESEENKLMLVLDEAHLYQGALGTEVGLLVRRLLSSLSILGEEYQNKVQFILTSASLGADTESKEMFVHGLTGRPRESEGWSYLDSDDVDWQSDLQTSSVFINGTKWMPDQGNPSDDELTEMREFLLSLNYGPEDPDNFLHSHLVANFDAPNEENELTNWFREHAIFRRLYHLLLEDSLSLDVLARELLGDDSTPEIRRMCMESILNFVASLRGPRPDSNPNRILPLLGVRAHLLYRGLPRLYWSLGNNRIMLREINSQHVSYPIRGCRRCGAPHLSIWIPRQESENLYSIIESRDNTSSWDSRTFSRPVNNSLRLEVYLYQDYQNDRGVVTVDGLERMADGPAHIWVDTESYRISGGPRPEPSERWLPGYLPGEIRQNPNDLVTLCEPEDDTDNAGRSGVQQVTFNQATCLQCGTLHQNRRTPQITDYMTRGDDPFSRLMGELISLQNPVDDKMHLPNKGKKVMAFSDSRSRAAKLAFKIQDNINYDELRKLVLHLINQPWYQELPGSIQSLDYIYSTFILHMAHAQLEPFASTGDDTRNARNSFAHSRLDVLAAHSAALFDRRDDPLVSEHEHLSRVIEYSDLELEPIDQARVINDIFVSNAPNSANWSRAARQSTRWRRSNNMGHKAYVRAIRAELKRALYQGIQNSVTENSLTSVEKGLVFGVMFDPELYNGEYTPDIEHMREILVELGLTFDDSDNIESNPFVRLEAILDHRNRAFMEIPRKRGYQEDVEHTRRMQDVRDAVRRVLARMRDELSDELFSRFNRAKTHLRTNAWTLEQLSQLASQIIAVVCDSDLLPNRLKLRHFTGVQSRALRRNSNGSPWEFSGAIIDFIGNRDFSLSGLGLGYAGVNPAFQGALRNSYNPENDPETTNEFNELWDEGLASIISCLIHWMTRPKWGDQDDGKDPNRGERCILSTEGRFTYRSMKNGGRSCYIAEADWGIEIDHIERMYRRLWNMKFSCEPIVEFTDISNSRLFIRNEHEDSQRWLLDARFVSLYTTMENDQLLGCHRCGLAMPIIDSDLQPTNCLNCGFEDIQPYNPEEHNILQQRIENPWRIPARRAIESSVTDPEVLVIRAEEHTAQINTTRDDEEMYTSAEEFELLFQDVPFVVPKVDDHWTLAQAPVDLLSCTTTMEVGIDIGSLTCVALRTIPRKNSNYQQRVGRAGRGSAEVCVAVSWCDNQPHAQNYFENPGEMLRPPDDSPVIYLDNGEIITRHVNAAIFQSFFKRMEYDIRLRRFTNMGEGEMERNLMESMGLLSEFFDANNDSEFNYIAFNRWIDGEPCQHEDEDMSWAEVRNQIEPLIPDSSELELDSIIEDLQNFLDETNERFISDRELVEGGED